jgi:acyl-CoA synthetase (AMP-forming)/AMP-acid ligase II
MTWDTDGTLVDLTRQRARSATAARGYTFVSGTGVPKARLSFAELDLRARAVAVELGRVARPGSRALLHYEPGLDFLIGFFGCLYAGVIAVPAAPLEGTSADSATAARLRAILRSAGPDVVLTTSPDTRPAPALLAESGLSGLTRVDTDLVDPGLAAGWSPPHIDENSVAYLQYSSGSTGEPKGVVITHRNVLHNLRIIAELLEVDEDTHGCFWLPMFHDMGLVSGGLMPLLAGGDVTLMAPMTFLQRPHVWLSALSRPRSVTAAPNFAYDHCVSRLSDRQRTTLDLSGWTCAIVGAERVRTSTLERFAGAFRPVGFREEAFLPCYGLAESVLMVTGGRLDLPAAAVRVDREALARGRARLDPGPGTSGDVGPADATVSLVGAGSVRPGLDVVVADPDTLRPRPAGELGEVLVAGPSVGAGYWSAPAQTAHTFGVTVPGRTGSFLRTGDVGMFLDGELYITGRVKDLIIVGGRNHHASDLEATVETSHEALRPGFCAVVSVDDGDGERVVVLAEVVARSLRVPADRAALTAADITTSIRRDVSAVHGVRVSDVLLLRPGSLPFTSSGKLQRFACRRGYVEGKFTASRALMASRDDLGGVA